MMTEQFGRRASATITNLVDGRQITVEGLRITFSISKTSKPADNKAKIKIYNLSKINRGVVQSQNDQSGKPKTLIELRTGYAEGDLKLVFRGQGSAVSQYAAPNWVTEITCTDGVEKLKSASFEKKYPAGTPVQNVMKDMLSAANFSKIITNSFSGVLPKARTFSGPVLENAQDLQSTYGFQFDIQDDEAIIRQNNNQTAKIYRVPLSRDSGMIGSPRAKGDIVVAEALINGDLKPSNYVELASLRNPELDGDYVIKRVDMKGDTWGGAWVSTIQMQRTKFVPVYTNLRDIDGVLA